MTGKSLGRQASKRDRNEPSRRLNPSPPPHTHDIGGSSSRTVAGLGTISVVVVTYNSAGCVHNCLVSVRDAFPEAELVVVDNGSHDETVRTIRAATPVARIIETGENIGYGRACNTGAEAARGTHVLFMNPDSVVAYVDRGRLKGLLAGEPFGLVAPTLEEEQEPRRIENTWPAEYFAHTFQTLRPMEWRRRSRRYNGGRETWVSGAILLVAREEFLGIGGFDPRFFLYYEDRDLSRRYRNGGLPIRTTDAVRGRHKAGGSSTANGFRAAPMAWSLLGWIQYVLIHDGESQARHAARTTLVTLRALRLGMHLLAAMRWPRARRKAQQLDEVLNFVTERASGGDTRFCPDALRVIRNLA